MDNQKLRKQNQNLKKELKQLNDQLNKILQKVQNKSKPEEQSKNMDGRMQIIKKQLQNQIKKNGILKKEIDQMKYKDKYLEGYKVDDLKNIIKEKDKIIEDLNAKIKLYQKLDKQEKNGDSYKKEEELTHKIMQQNQEIIHLKKKMVDQKKNQEQFEKTIKTLREQITAFQSKTPQKVLQSKSKDKNETNITITKQEYEKLNEKYKQLQSSKKMNDKSSKQEIESLILKLKNYQREFMELKDEVSKKEKEGNILMFKLKEKERKNFNTMEPIKTVRYSEQILHSSNLFENRKQFKGLTFGQGIYRQFDDSKFLPIQKNYRIKKITFTHFEQHILSLTTQYEILDNQSSKQIKKTTKIIQSFAIGSQYTNIKVVQYVFMDYQYIATFQIYTLKAIELIRIVTSKEEIVEIGNTKNIPKYKKHVFDIRNHQKPISFMGVVENKRVNGDSKEYLISLGAEIRRKQVFIRSKSNKKQDSTHRKSFLDKLNAKVANQL